MSIGRRLFDLARANLSSMLAREPQGELERYSDEELEAELSLRQARRKRRDEQRASREVAERAAQARPKEPARPSPNVAGAAPGAAPTGATDARQARERRSGARGGGGGPSRAPAQPDRERARIAKLYAQLETPVGADLETVKHNFRRLMRASHPDLAGPSPERQRHATSRTADLTTAFAELERILGGR